MCKHCIRFRVYNNEQKQTNKQQTKVPTPKEFLAWTNIRNVIETSDQKRNGESKMWVCSSAQPLTGSRLTSASRKRELSYLFHKTALNI